MERASLARALFFGKRDKARTMDKIFLSGLRVDAMIGIYPDERVSTRPVEIDLEIGIPGDRVFRSGDIADTVGMHESTISRVAEHHGFR